MFYTTDIKYNLVYSYKDTNFIFKDILKHILPPLYCNHSIRPNQIFTFHVTPHSFMYCQTLSLCILNCLLVMQTEVKNCHIFTIGNMKVTSHNQSYLQSVVSFCCSSATFPLHSVPLSVFVCLHNLFVCLLNVIVFFQYILCVEMGPLSPRISILFCCETVARGVYQAFLILLCSVIFRNTDCCVTRALLSYFPTNSGDSFIHVAKQDEIEST